MIVGFDYWQVISHFPEQIEATMGALDNDGHEVHVISAIGKDRVGTIPGNVRAYIPWLPDSRIHEVVFNDPKQSPELKLAKCQELGLTVFYDDRDDVCRLLNKNGILALRVTRKDNSTYDLEAERK